MKCIHLLTCVIILTGIILIQGCDKTESPTAPDETGTPPNQVLYSTSPSQCVTPPPGLVSWWDGDAVSGAIAFDLKDQNDGILASGVSTAPGKVGQAFSFDGVDDIVRVSTVSGIEVQQFTIDAWVFSESPGFHNDVLGGIIVSKDIGDTSIPPHVSWGLVGLGNTNRYHADIGFTDGSLHFLSSTNTFAFNTFNHVAATWDGSTLNLYVNGQLEGTLNLGPRTVAYSGEALTIGEHNTLPARRAFDGLIDEVEFYNRALSASEIQAIYNAGSAGKCKFIEVEIDIKPGSDPNCFNNNGHGVIPVAILGSVDFDVQAVDAATVQLEGMAVRAVGKSNKLLAHYEDVNGDGIEDLVVKIEDVDGAFEVGDDTATLTGNLFDGTEFQGSDSICIVP